MQVSRRRAFFANVTRARKSTCHVLAFAFMLCCGAVACGTAGGTAPGTPRASVGVSPRVLLIGDSILDQEGGAAAFLLRQQGIGAAKVAVWGSGLLTRDQYDMGHTILSGSAPPNPVDWLTKAQALVAQYHPELVVVAMNHNHESPYPRDADGNEIVDLRSAEGRAMIAAQTNALIDILQHDGARVMFVTPPPEGSERAPGDNPIWSATLPVLHARHIAVADVAPAVSGADGGRVESMRDCRGNDVRVRKPEEVHYTRFGAGRAGTVLADAITAFLHSHRNGDAAPGDHTVALVPTVTGNGYWLVQCDGSVFHFGDAAAVSGVSGTVDEPIVAAVRAPRGLWLVARDGRVSALGGAPERVLRPAPSQPIVAAVATRSGDGIVAVTASGVLSSSDGRTPSAPRGARDVVGIAWSSNGVVFATASDGVAIAATPDGKGAWVVERDGSIVTRGDARGEGNAVRPPVRPDVVRALGPSAPPPVVSIVASRRGGYWIVRDNGEVTARGVAPKFGGTNNLALFTD